MKRKLKSISALRYLLLRHIRDLGSYYKLDHFEEISNSLHIVRERGLYKISWRSNGKEFLHDFGVDDFDFYIRGDTRKQQTSESVIDYNKNDRVARNFAADMLRVSVPTQLKIKEPLEPYFLLNFVGYLTLGILVFTFNHTLALLAILLPVLFLAEYWTIKGKVVTALLLIVLFLLDFPHAASVSALFYALFQFFDPNINLKKLRVFLPFMIFLYGLYFIVKSDRFPVLGWELLPLIIICIISFILRSLSISHFRSFSLVFPFMIFAFSLDGLFELSFILSVINLVAVILLSQLYCVLPVQQENATAPDGTFWRNWC